ncbi:MAG: hypothetical protein KJO77_05875 [Bacteroidia bacterium]|nr:hypothetical protein [Bacteroidia bacterium]NND51208.1 hypothetical protein [Flavobacteriaceae bacterium]
MEAKYITLHSVALNNNCPECYSKEGLQLTFKQRFIENRFYKSITHDTISQLKCSNCDTDIFPVRWTDDIEKVVEYHNKAFTPKPASFKLKRLAWIIMILLDTIIVLSLLYAFGVFENLDL